MILDTKIYKGACEKDTNFMADRKKDDAGKQQKPLSKHPSRQSKLAKHFMLMRSS